MKGFIEVTSDSRVKMFLSVSGIWSMVVEANGLVGIYINPQSPGRHFEVLESMDEIAAKIEAATEQKTETCEWCDENFRYTQGGMEKRRYAYDTEDIDIGRWRYCPVCGRKVEVRG